MMSDNLELAILAGAVRALRRGAERQAAIAAADTAYGDRGAIIRQGEAVVALRLEKAFADLAHELDREARI